MQIPWHHSRHGRQRLCRNWVRMRLWKWICIFQCNIIFKKHLHNSNTPIQQNKKMHHINTLPTNMEWRHSMQGVTNPHLLGKTSKHMSKPSGKFLLYSRFINGMMLTALSALTIQNHETSQTILDYCTSQEPAVITYHKSGTVFAEHSNAGYWNQRNEQCQAGWHHYLSNDAPFPSNNRAILNIIKIIITVMPFTAEAKMGLLYINTCKAVKIRQILKDMRHP